MKLVLVITPARPGEKRKFTAPPLGLLYLGSYIKTLGHDVKVIDADVEGYTLDELAKKIIEEKADLIGITVMTTFAANVLNICKKIKHLEPSSKICLGGIHITATGTEMIEESKYVDYLVISEGEYTLKELLEALKNKTDLSKIKGLVYRGQAAGQIIKNEPRMPIQDIDSLPIPDLDLIENLNFKNYDAAHSEGKKIVNILGSRGCPFLCSFCAAHLVHGRRVRLRSAKKIVDEIEYNQKKYNIGYVSFKDGTFTFNHSWVKEICEEIIKRNLKIGFCINSRVNTLNEEILKIMKQAGCKTIGFGVESGSQKILDVMEKGTTVEQIRKAFKLVNKMKFFTVAAFMIGNPGDTKETMDKTLQLAMEIKPTAVAFSPLTAFPGTGIYFDGIKDGTLKNPKWYLKKNPGAEDEFLPTGNYDGVLAFPNFKVEDELKKVYHKFYFRPAYFISIIKRIINRPYFLKYSIDYALGMMKKTFDNT